MAIKELRKFKFFDLSENVDNGALALALKETRLAVATSGNNLFIFGDNEGNIILLNRKFEIEKSFKAYNVTITHCEYIKHSTFLVTVGEDEPGINPLLKVWNFDVTDKGGTPRCVRLTRLIPNQKAAAVTAVGLHESANFLAIGFDNGSILLFRGNVARNRNSKPKLLNGNENSPITGLAFRTTAMSSFLFVTTANSVVSYDISIKDKEIKWQLDKEGCAIGCSAMADLPHEAQFIVAREAAIYCYNTDGKGPCYPIPGNKVLVEFSKANLAIVAEEKRTQIDAIGPGPSDASETSGDHLVQIFDFRNNFIVLSLTVSHVAAIVVEYGSFYIITKDNKIHQLIEKDVRSKLAMLFKKNLYEAAIRMAKSQHYDEDGLVDIFRQYGDYLNSKGDRAGAIEQYIKTIGKLEPSYIIRKFMDSAHMEQLIEYLQALHQRGLATGDHTTLLFNCFIKLGKTTELKDFIMTKGKKVDFDIEIALKVVRGVKPEDALTLAKLHERHLWVMRILLEDFKNFTQACSYLNDLEPEDAAKCILDFGAVLMENCPVELTRFLKKFCKEHRDDPGNRRPQLFYLDNEKPRNTQPQDFLHLFLLKSEYLVDFLESLVEAETGWDTKIYNALIEHYLVLWKKNVDKCAPSIELKLMTFLQNPDTNYDRDHVFLLCQMYDFAPGQIFLYEENKMYYQVVQAHIEQKNYKGVLAACRRFGNQDPNIWIQALWASTRHSETPQHILSEILSIIEKERLQPPLMTLDALDENNTLGQARRYLSAVLESEEKLIETEKALIEKYGTESCRIQDHIKEIEGNTVIFQGSRCSVCSRQLELPSVHFLCQHSYHQHCFQGYADNENECIVCVKNNKVLRDTIKLQEKNHELHEPFHNKLQKADDSFTVVADYFGKGVFNKVNIASPPPPPKSIIPPVRIPEKQIAPEPKVYQPPAPIKPEPEPQSSPKTTKLPETISSSYENPFELSDDEGEDYDASKNPFAEEATESARVLSDKSSDYDDDLNPFT